MAWKVTYTNGVDEILMGGCGMNIETIGANIRKVRLEKKMRQEDLAEKAELTPNYIGAIERGEKIPSLESLVAIINALGTSSNIIFRDVIEADYTVKTSLLSDKIDKLSKESRENVYAVIDTMISRLK